MKELTKAEEQVMQNLWSIGKGYLKDIVEQFPEPRPAYTTISTVIRVLVKKGFIAHNTYGKVHEYYPLIEKEHYFNTHFNGLIKNFFNGSVAKFASFFANSNQMSLTQLEAIKKQIDKEIDELKKKDK
ncbi:MAG: BlaI/MecI/CopY family transcriptional regulator [Bacteroidales bacterium]|nr:BlaI/MecI/CopY family transcriptional regulator [Bacteroidales bacterium]MBN2821474.1 BlaI/MecI/CopY family transcriptional regulator [Bacteroidales bacterium]